MHQLGQAVFGQKVSAARAAVVGTLALIADPKVRIDTEGMTVARVHDALWSFLRHSDLEPEWLCLANINDHANEEAFGARHGRTWPSRFSADRISVSVCIGSSEGWIVHVDWITRRAGETSERTYAVMPLLRAKVFNRDQAWDLARVIAHKLDAA